MRVAVGPIVHTRRVLRIRPQKRSGFSLRTVGSPPVAESGPPADETLIRQVARVLYRCDRGDWAGAMEAWDEDEYRDTAYHRTARALYEAGLLRGELPADGGR
jgi:hypothetical protein